MYVGFEVVGEVDALISCFPGIIADLVEKSTQTEFHFVASKYKKWHISKW